MAPLKRKPKQEKNGNASGDSPLKKNSPNPPGQSKKRKHEPSQANLRKAGQHSSVNRKVENISWHRTTNISINGSCPPAVQTSSLLRKGTEIDDFPRGNALINEGTKPALTIRSSKKDAADDDCLFKTSETKETSVQTTKKDRSQIFTQKKKQRKVLNQNENKVRDIVQIRSISYKRLNARTILFGRIVNVSKHDITVHLPNNLAGYVSITNVSDQILKKIEADLAQDSSDEGSHIDEFSKADLPKLSTVVQIGQWCRVCVVEINSSHIINGTDETKKKHISLSMKPQDVNYDLDPKDIVPNIMLQVSVMSIEDYGVIVDTGIKNLKGFIEHGQFGNLRLESLHVGQPILCSVLSLAGNKKTVQLTADCSRFTKFLAMPPKQIQALAPGMPVQLSITDIRPNGVTGKIYGSANASADLIHCGTFSPQKIFKVKQSIRARIVATHLDNQQPISVSLLSHVVALRPLQNNKLELPIPIGFIVEGARVIHIEPVYGLFMDIGVENVYGFAHISRLSDNRVDIIQITSGPYKIDTTHRVRVVNYNAVDGLYYLSLEPKFLENSD